MDINRSRKRIHVVSPNLFLQVFPGVRRPWMLHKIAQKLNLASGKGNDFSLAGYGRSEKIDSHLAELVDLPVTRGLSRNSPEKRFNPGHEFDHLKWLGEVIVGADLEPENFVDRFTFRGQHYDRHHETGFPDITTDIKTLFPRHHHVKNDELKPALKASLEP